MNRAGELPPTRPWPRVDSGGDVPHAEALVDEPVEVDVVDRAVLVAVEDDERGAGSRKRRRGSRPVFIAANAEPTSWAAPWARPEWTPAAAYRSG